MRAVVKVALGALAAIGGWELYSHRKTRGLAAGRRYALTLGFDGAGTGALSPSEAQLALDMSLGQGLFTACASPAPVTDPAAHTLTLCFDARASKVVKTSDLANNYPAGYGAVAFKAIADAGPTPAGSVSAMPPPGAL